MNYLKITLAILLLLCLLDMPYGFYQLVRLLAMLGFGILAYKANQNDNSTVVVLFIGLAILFQPLFKISLGRTLWNIIDIVVAIGLLISLRKDKTTN